MVTSSKRSIAAGEFKARCLAILDDVQETRRAVTVTKRGKPVARVVPVPSRGAARSLKGSVVEAEDIVSPLHGVWKRRA